MWKNKKLCLGTGEQFCMPVDEQIRLFRRHGFDSFFIYREDVESVRDVRRTADELGMELAFVHAPYMRLREMWTPESKSAEDELVACIRDCSDAGVGLAVFHTIIGREMHSPNGYGIESFGRVVDEAGRLGVRVAFENTEGEEYLAALMDAFSEKKNVGYCWDSGHEQCYNDGRDMLSPYADRLTCVHLNDNLGMSDEHFLPFEGIIDWSDLVRRLNDCGFDGTLTFEIKTLAYPYHLENGKHDREEVRRFLSEAYTRACRLSAMKERDLRGR